MSYRDRHNVGLKMLALKLFEYDPRVRVTVAQNMQSRWFRAHGLDYQMRARRLARTRKNPYLKLFLLTELFVLLAVVSLTVWFNL